MITPRRGSPPLRSPELPRGDPENNWRNDAGLAGRSVLITGAAGGIGSAVARAVAEAGAVVGAVDLAADALDQLVADLPGSGHLALPCDVTDLAAQQRVLAETDAAAPLIGLLHAAAVIKRRASIDEITEADVDLQLGVNLRATFFLDRACWRVLRTRGGGSIVNVASQGWWSGGFGGSTVYAATKGGVVSLTRGLARSFAADGVRVNALAPGMVDTAMMQDGLDDEDRRQLLTQVPLGRLAAPDELTGAVLFLLSDASSYVTGAVINISGGQLMY